MKLLAQSSETKAPLFAIVIPCYNDGQYLPDAIASVRQCNTDLYELIVVNDGSTDGQTLDYLKLLEKEGVRVLHQSNKRMSAARNAGIAETFAPYILPLDSDNKLRPEYLTEAKQIFDKHPDVDVVYSDCEYFGSRSGVNKAPEPMLYHLLRSNYIDTCSVFRRNVWEKLNGFDERMRTGVEDWDFWLRAMCLGFKFHHIPEVLFDYRVRSGSVTETIEPKKVQQTAFEYMHSKTVEIHVRDLIKETDHFAWWRSAFQQKPFRMLLLSLNLCEQSILTKINFGKCGKH